MTFIEIKDQRSSLPGTLAILANSGLGVKRTLLINLVPAFLSYLGFTIGKANSDYKMSILTHKYYEQDKNENDEVCAID